MKSNKSFKKRLRLTKKGKIVVRVPGHNHFNARQNGSQHLRRKRAAQLEMTAADRSRFLNA